MTTGDFLDVRTLTTATKGKEKPKEVEEHQTITQGNELFSCPVDGCVCTFQRHSSLEEHMFYGKCKIVPERYSLLGQAQMLYRNKLMEGSSVQPFIAGPVVPTSSQATLPRGWALKSSKKGGRFNNNQKQYLDDKFSIGQHSGRKADPAQVAQDMRYAKSDDGSRRFSVNEFLTPQQIKSYFSRAAAKLRSGKPRNNDENDAKAIEDQAAYSSTREVVIKECQITHPVIYDTYNICDMCAANKLKTLRIAMLRLICNHFDLDIDGISETRKAPFIKLISELVASCSCN